MGDLLTAGKLCTHMHGLAVESTLRKHAQGVRLCGRCMHSAEGPMYAYRHTVTCCAGSEPPAGYRQAREAGMEALPLPVQAAKLRTPRAGPSPACSASNLVVASAQLTGIAGQTFKQSWRPQVLADVLCELSWSASHDKPRAEAAHMSAAHLAWQLSTLSTRLCKFYHPMMEYHMHIAYPAVHTSVVAYSVTRSLTTDRQILGAGRTRHWRSGSAACRVHKRSMLCIPTHL